MYNLIPSLNNYKVALAKFITSVKIHRVYDLIFVKEEAQQFYLGDGTSVANTLLPFQTAVKTHRPVAINATAVATVAQVKVGVITSTSVAATSITLPTATLLATALKAARGTWFDFAVDNSGPNTVTLVVGTGITAATAVITGGATLTIATATVGLFRIYFTSASTAIIYRLG